MILSTKNQIASIQTSTNNQLTTSRNFDLEDRTLNFAKEIIDLVNKFPKDIINIEIIKQIIRSSGSIGANYIEANEALGKKDFYMRIRIVRKEAKETRYWLKLLVHNNPEFENLIDKLIEESSQFIKIFSSIASKAKI